MPRPTLPEAVADVRRVYGAGVQLRLPWSGERSVVFQVLTDGGVASYLKVGNALADERDRLDWLERRLPVPRTISFGSVDDTDWLLTTPADGLDLSNLKHTAPPTTIAGWMADALHAVHAVDVADCPFGDRTTGDVLIHGDACLPNFLFSRGRLSGVIDVGGARLGRPPEDLATAVWSLQYNLGNGHGAAFLDTYGVDLDTNGLTLVTNEHGEEALQVR